MSLNLEQLSSTYNEYHKSQNSPKTSKTSPAINYAKKSDEIESKLNKRMEMQKLAEEIERNQQFSKPKKSFSRRVSGVYRLLLLLL